MPEGKEDIQTKFFKTLTWYFSEKQTPTGFFHTVGDIRDKLQDLNKSLNEANQSQDRLTSALNRITLWGVIIAAATLLWLITEFILKNFVLK